MRRLRGDDSPIKRKLCSSIVFWHWGSSCGQLIFSVLVLLAFGVRRASLTSIFLRLSIRGKLLRAGELSRKQLPKVFVRLLSLLGGPGGLVPVLCERLRVRGVL